MEFLNTMRRRREDRRVERWLTKGRCFLQGDGSIANQAGAAFRSDLNSELQAIIRGQDGTSAPGTTYPYQIWNDTTNNVQKQRNAANSGWIIRRTLAETRTFSRTSNTILALADFGCFFVAPSGGFTQTLTAAATLGDGWMCFYRVESGHTVTFDPNSSENIDGATTKAVVGPASGIIYCNGSAFLTVGFAGTSAASDSAAGLIELAVQSEMETGTDVTRAVTPGRQHFHPSAAKAWAYVTLPGGAAALSVGYNQDAVTDNGTGDVTLNHTTDFSGAAYAYSGSIESDSAGSSSRTVQVRTGGQAAGSFRVNLASSAGVSDQPAFSIVFFGDFA